MHGELQVGRYAELLGELKPVVTLDDGFLALIGCEGRVGCEASSRQSEACGIPTPSRERSAQHQARTKVAAEPADTGRRCSELNKERNRWFATSILALTAPQFLF